MATGKLFPGGSEGCLRSPWHCLYHISARILGCQLFSPRAFNISALTSSLFPSLSPFLPSFLPFGSTRIWTQGLLGRTLPLELCPQTMILLLPLPEKPGWQVWPTIPGPPFSFPFLFFFFWWDWGFELRTSHLQSRLSTAWATPEVHFAVVIFEMGLVNYLPGLALNCNHPDLSLPSSLHFL
jgi:hypothetical protein